MIRYASFPTPYGEVFLAKTEQGICRIHLGDSEETFTRNIQTKYHAQPTKNQLSLKDEISKLSSYFEDGHPIDNMQVDFLEGTPFERKVWEALREIPRGKVRSYGSIAEEIGSPRASRAVGGACGSNPVPFIVPCHRVISSSGTLGGYGYGLKVKRELLKLEGYDVSTLKS